MPAFIVVSCIKSDILDGDPSPPVASFYTQDVNVVRVITADLAARGIAFSIISTDLD